MSKSPQPKTTLSFYEALQKLADGAKITKQEWGDPRIYGALIDGRVKLFKGDSIHDWVFNDGDLGGTDWYVL